MSNKDKCGCHDSAPLLELSSHLAAGWHIAGSSFVKPGCARECRVVLVNRERGRKLFGFGESFAEAFSVAQAQMAPGERGANG